MAIIKCEECGKDISTKADTCPHCGAPLTDEKSLRGTKPSSTAESKGISASKVIKITLIVIFTIIALFFILTYGFCYMVGSNVTSRLDEARIEQTKIQIAQLELALKLFEVDNGFYPETQQGLEALIRPPTVGRIPHRYSQEGYLEGGKLPLDQWGSEYVYLGPDQTQDGSFEIISPGQDGKLGTKDDISNRNIKNNTYERISNPLLHLTL